MVNFLFEPTEQECMWYAVVVRMRKEKRIERKIIEGEMEEGYTIMI